MNRCRKAVVEPVKLLQWGRRDGHKSDDGVLYGEIMDNAGIRWNAVCGETRTYRVEWGKSRR